MGNWRVTSLLALVLLVTLLAAAGCGGHARGAVYVRTPPPPAVQETITVSPGPNYVWIPGHHVWRGDAYFWEGGRWEIRPTGRRDWVPGHWNQTRHGWIWVDGHWR